MLLIHAVRPLRISKANACLRFLAALALIAGLWLSQPVAQAQSGQAQATSTATPTPTPKTNAPADAGGPQGDIGPIAVPKKKDEPSPKDDAPKAPKKVEGLDNYSMRVASQLVTVDVGVLSKDGAFLPGLKKEYFRVLEDNVPQTITNFNQSQAPITAGMLVEFSNNQYFYSFQIDSIKSAYVFAQTLKKEDWIAMISYDLKSHILEDFT